MKIGKIDSLNKTIVNNNNLHLETVEELKRTHMEAIREERIRCSKNINHIDEEMAELKNKLVVNKNRVTKSELITCFTFFYLA